MIAVFSIIKRLLASNKISFILTILVVFCATSSSDAKVVLSNGNYTYLLALMSPFFFVLYDYGKLMHLGSSKKHYFIGAIISYAILAFGISLVNSFIYLVIDPLNKSKEVINLMNLCGWTANGVIVAFFQQMIFLFLVMLFIHTLLSMQDKWYGWVTDLLLVLIICVFTPIAPLRSLLSEFFQLIMFNNNAFWHIGICLILSVGFIFTSLVILKKKEWA